MFTIGGESYFPLSVLGRGGTSVVYRVLSSSTRQLLALKVISLTTCPTSLLSLQSEVDCMTRLRGCPHAIQLVHSEQGVGCFYLLMQLGSSDLASFISTLHPPPPPPPPSPSSPSTPLPLPPTPLHPLHLRSLWLSLLQCVSACHGVGILHRDLKPANFVFVDGRLVMLDFGIARLMGEQDPSDPTSVISQQLTGTINYMSPESLEVVAGGGAGGDGDGGGEGGGAGGAAFRQGRKSDVWSLGCMLYQLVYGACPFAHVQGVLHKMRAIADSRVSIVYPDKGGGGMGRVDSQAVDVMRLCLQRDVRQRASVEQLLAHPFVNPHQG